MQISIVSSGGSTHYSPPAGYKWKIVSLGASVTGTSSAVSSVVFTLQRLDQSGNVFTLLSVTSTTTDLTVFGTMESVQGAQTVLYHPLYLSSPDDLYVTVTNNSSVNWTINLIESPEDE